MFVAFILIILSCILLSISGVMYFKSNYSKRMLYTYRKDTGEPFLSLLDKVNRECKYKDLSSDQVHTFVKLVQDSITKAEEMYNNLYNDVQNNDLLKEVGSLRNMSSWEQMDIGGRDYINLVKLLDTLNMYLDEAIMALKKGYEKCKLKNYLLEELYGNGYDNGYDLEDDRIKLKSSMEQLEKKYKFEGFKFNSLNKF